MKHISDISYWELALSLSLLIIPITIFAIYRVKIIKTTLVSVVRMIIQLALVAIYLEWVFDKNSALLNVVWVLVMILVGVITTIKRIGLNWRVFILPFLLASFTSAFIIDAFLLGAVIKLDYMFDARYFIPISGMVLGNALKHNIVGLSSYFNNLNEKTDLYQFILINSGSKKLALRPFIAEALKHALNPMIAGMSVVGLISLPGMMTGQILGGSSPSIAIKYQALIMIAIFVGCSINLFLSLALSNRFIFDGYGNLKQGIFNKKKDLL